MTALVSVIIADMVPVRDVAAWRSYVNVAATTGRAMGGPVGGWLCDKVGWRWCFYGQVPLTIIGLLLIIWKMPSRTSQSSSPSNKSLPNARIELQPQTLTQKFKRIDTLGALALASTISAFLLTLDFAARGSPLLHLLLSAFTTLILATIFTLIEKHWAKEPILPLRLLVTRPASCRFRTEPSGCSVSQG